jgi:hypothetical protein
MKSGRTAPLHLSRQLYKFLVQQKNDFRVGKNGCPLMALRAISAPNPLFFIMLVQVELLSLSSAGSVPELNFL